MEKIFGIDLGTTTSSISYMKDGEPVIIPVMDNNYEKNILPSIVGRRERNGKIYVGEEAEGLLYSVEEAKREMGTDKLFNIGGERECTAVEISAEILKKLKDEAENSLGEEVKKVVITVPAQFNNNQRRETINAGLLAGLEVVELINEPTAAALCYGLKNIENEEKILVYDFGGGTFDVSIIELHNEMLEVLTSSGDNHLGGKDIDEIIVSWVLENSDLSHLKISDDEKESVIRDIQKRIKKISREAKETLSTKDESEIREAEYLISLKLTREKFEGMIREIVEKTLTHIEKALYDARLDKDDISYVVLVGGTTRIPLIKDMLKEYFGDKVMDFLDPQEIVAMGAAVKGQAEITVKDVSNYDLGTSILKEYKGQKRTGVYDKLIEKNRPLPYEMKKRYYTVYPGQTRVNIDVYEGSNDLVEDNTFIGEFIVDEIPKTNQCEAVDITFKYDASGVLKVEVEVIATGKVYPKEYSYKGTVGPEKPPVIPPTGPNPPVTPPVTPPVGPTPPKSVRESAIYSDYHVVYEMLEEKINENPEYVSSEIKDLLEEFTNAIIAEDKEKSSKIEEKTLDLLLNM